MKHDFLITVKNLSKQYKDVLALNDVSFDLMPGEVLGLLGPNGAGKTTIIHVLLGLLTPTSGTVSVLGFSPITQRYNLAPKINFSSAYTSLPSNLKVIENLKIFAGLYNVPNASDKIHDLLVLFGMEHLKDRLTGAMSSGEKTRLNLCKSLLNDPELLLLDEPTASLDPDMAQKVREILKSLQKERGIGILYTSHDMNEVTELCDRVLFVNQGHLMAQGSIADLLKTYHCKNLEEVFIHLVRS